MKEQAELPVEDSASKYSEGLPAEGLLGGGSAPEESEGEWPPLGDSIPVKNNERLLVGGSTPEDSEGLPVGDSAPDKSSEGLPGGAPSVETGTLKGECTMRPIRTASEVGLTGH